MARTRWNVAEAKAKFSQVLQDAKSGPQIIESRGREVGVVLDNVAYAELAALRDRQAPRRRLLEFLAWSDAIRREGSAELEIPAREIRPSPFSDEDEG